MGWKFPWASSFNSDFNNDFSVSITEKRQREVGVDYNYRREAVIEWRAGQEGGGEGRRPSSRPCAEPTRLRTIAIGRA